MNGKKFVNKTLALVLALVLTVGLLPIQASAATADFSDVPANHWAYADVMRARSSGIVSGVGDNKFEPDRTVANAEMIKMVVNAVFKTNYEAYEEYNYDDLRSHFGDNLHWYSFMAYYAKNFINILDGIDVDIDSDASCTRPMTRYDMAMILSNAAKAEGIEATEAQKAAAQGSIQDYASIPAKYQDAVKNCFALKTRNANGDTISLLTGENGNFNGSNSMTRAQACAVIVRLENLMLNGGPVDAGPVVTPTPEPTPAPVPAPSQSVVPSSGIKDIKGTQFETAINALYAGGIITDADLTNGNFRPNDNLTYGECALMYIRAFKGLTMAKKSDYPYGIKFNGVDYTYVLDTPEGIADDTLGNYYTGYVGGPKSIADNETMDVRSMHSYVYNIVRFVTNTTPNPKWQPSWHGYGNPVTQHYGECGAFDGLDPARVNTTSWHVTLTRGEWCQIMYNLGITQAGTLTTSIKMGGVISG